MSLLLTTHTWSLFEILLINCGAAHWLTPTVSPAVLPASHGPGFPVKLADCSPLATRIISVSVFSKGYNWTLFQDHTDRFFAVCWNFWKCAFLLQNRRTLPLIQPPNHNAHGMDMLASACLCSASFPLPAIPHPFPSCLYWTDITELPVLQKAGERSQMHDGEEGVEKKKKGRRTVAQ